MRQHHSTTYRPVFRVGENFGAISLLIIRRHVTDMHCGLVGSFLITAPTTVSNFAHLLYIHIEPDYETSITIREAAKVTVPPVNAPKNFTPLDSRTPALQIMNCISIGNAFIEIHTRYLQRLTTYHDFYNNLFLNHTCTSSRAIFKQQIGGDCCKAIYSL